MSWEIPDPGMNYTTGEKGTSAKQNKVVHNIDYIADAVKDLNGSIEEYTIVSTDWTDLDPASEPYTKRATITATYDIDDTTIISLLNDQAVLFARHGFAVGNVVNKNITIYSIGAPLDPLTLKIKYNEELV